MDTEHKDSISCNNILVDTLVDKDNILDTCNLVGNKGSISYNNILVDTLVAKDNIYYICN